MSAAVDTQQEASKKHILEELERLGGQTVKQDEVTFEGRRIILPSGTTLTENARFLAQLAKDQEEITSWFRSYTYKPWDVAYCLSRGFKRIFGAMRHSGSMGMFGPNPPSFVEIPSGPGEMVQVPQGTFTIPHLPGVTFEVGSRYDDEWGLVGFVSAEGPKREAARVNGVFEIIREELETASLYRGKAIEYGQMPNFIDVDRIDPSRIVYSAEVEAALNTHVMAKMRYPDDLAEEGVGFRCKVLLSGEFGVGKTEALRLVAKEAQRLGYTYIVVPKNESDNMMDAMRMAKAYARPGCIVACEDVDTFANADLESSHIARVLDAFDGSQAKSADVMVLLTTNYAEQIQAGMLRPGRIDRMIVVREPDAAGIQRLVEVNVKRLADDINWEAVTQSMQGYHPAFVVRVATDAVEYATVRQLEDKRPKDERVVNTDDLIAAAVEIRPQFDMHTGARRQAGPPQTIDNAVRKVVASTLEENLDDRVHRTEGVAMRDREFFLRCKSCGEHDVYVEATWTETSTTYYYCSYEPEIDIEEDGTMEVRFDWDDVIGYGSDYAADYESEFGYSDNEMFRCTNCHAECHLVEAGFEVVYMDGEDVVAVGSDDEESKLQKAAVDLAVKIVATQNAGDDLDQLLSEINTIKTGG